MTFTILSLIIVSVLLNTMAQLSLKAGMLEIGYFSFNLHSFFPIALKIATSPWVLCGLGAYVLSMITWLLVLSRTEVSMAYPMISLGYIVSAIAAHYLWGEHLGIIRIFGIFIILLGVFLVAKN